MVVVRSSILVALAVAACYQPNESFPDARMGGETPDAADGTPDATPVAAIDTTILSAPPAATALTFTRFAFDATADATFTCTLDDVALPDCTSPVAFDATVGAHTFAVTATSRQAPTIVDPTPATHAWVVDQTPPLATLLFGPSGLTNSATAVFELEANEVVTYLCSIDGGAFEACSSPWTVGPLADGTHVAVILAVDAAGNITSAPVAVSWTIDTTPPTITFTEAPADPTEIAAPMITFVTDEPADALCELAGGAAAAPCDGEFAVPTQANGDHAFTVTAVDAAGNVGTATTAWLLDIVNWTPTPIAPSRAPAVSATSSSLIAYDTVRDVVIAVTGEPDAALTEAQTWLWDGAAWSRHPGIDPPKRLAGSLTFHAGTGTAVLFGGGDVGASTIRGDTWVWDGNGWTEVTPAGSPPARQLQATTYDPVTDQVLLFGGRTTTTNGHLADFWAWDGAAWTQLTPPTLPVARSSSVMAYDAVRDEVVLFGGFNNFALNDGAGYLRETWRWDRTDWTLLAPTNRPSIRWMPAMTFDAAHGQVVLFGGYHFQLGQYMNDTWIWSGTDWTLATPTPMPAPRYGGNLVFDEARQTSFLIGGATVPTAGSVIPWTWDGTTWTDVTPPATPTARAGVAAAYDPRRAVITMFGGAASGQVFTDTWSVDATAWIPRKPDVSPTAGDGAVMAFDAARDEVILFGGVDQAGDVSDQTWSWDGAQWTLLAPAMAPPARAGAVLVDDAIHDELVLFGGVDAGDALLGDTWLWNGVTWRDGAALDSPTPRRAAAAAYDASAQVAIIFGGDDGDVVGDTWAWNGTTWTERLSAETPPARAGAALVVDESRGALVLFGGFDGAAPLADTWIWHGAAWTPRHPVTSPPARDLAAAAFDGSMDAPRVLGGADGSGALTDAWRLD